MSDLFLVDGKFVKKLDVMKILSIVILIVCVITFFVYIISMKYQHLSIKIILIISFVILIGLSIGSIYSSVDFRKHIIDPMTIKKNSQLKTTPYTFVKSCPSTAPQFSSIVAPNKATCRYKDGIFVGQVNPDGTYINLDPSDGTFIGMDLNGKVIKTDKFGNFI